jgi:hypothetical protein
VEAGAGPYMFRMMLYYQLAKVNKMRLKQHPDLVANFPCQSAAEPRFWRQKSAAGRLDQIKSRY